MRHWLITGVSSGLGRALANAALMRGDRVTGTLRDRSAAKVFEELGPGRASAEILDVTDAQAVRDLVSRAGPVDILVNNAGFSLEGVLEASAPEDVLDQFEVHLLAPVRLIQAVLPSMRERRSGRILSIGSLAAHLSGGGVAPYAAAKAAIETLAANLASEVAPFGIKVTTIVPGAFRTSLGQSRKSAGVAIEDYAEADAARRRWFAAWSGTQRGDPSRAADAILAVCDFEDPPSRVALGPDAVEGLRTHAEELIRCAEWSSDLRIKTDFV